MIKFFINNIHRIFRGKQGIKQVYRGNKKIYERTGGYFYITLESE